MIHETPHRPTRHARPPYLERLGMAAPPRRWAPVPRQGNRPVRLTRKHVARLAVALIIANEIRGALVVASLAWAWWA